MIDKYNIKKMRGILDYQVIKNDKIISEENHNLILDNADKVLARMLAFGSYDPDVLITKIVFGTNNAASNSATTSLSGDTYTKDFVGVIYESVNTVKYSFVLEASEFNNKDIWQFALSTGENELFSMFSRNPTFLTPIEKTDEVIIVGNWKIIFDS